jgi:DNA-binding transcriptional MerR regulator
MGVQPIRKTVAPEIPDKLYFRIGDVARLCEVPAYVLRFWETEFPQLKPNKGGTGQRLYRKRDVEMALRIKSLLYDQGYTIPGARQVFKAEAKARELAASEAFTPLPVLTETAAQPFAAEAEPATRSPYDAGAEIRRHMQLLALRSELQDLLNLLGAPGIAPAEPPQVLALRPRLVLEPKSDSRPVAPRPETLRLVPDLETQGDLFAGE